MKRHIVTLCAQVIAARARRERRSADDLARLAPRLSAADRTLCEGMTRAKLSPELELQILEAALSRMGTCWELPASVRAAARDAGRAWRPL